MPINFKRLIFTIKTQILRPKFFNAFLKSEHELSKGFIEELNLKKRQELVKYANLNSPFYRNKYENVLNNSSLISEEDFLKLPPLTRDELVSNFNTIKVQGIKTFHTRKLSSSGSTGRPVTVLHDLRSPFTSLQWRILYWWGVKPYENQAFIYRYKCSLFKRIVNTVLWWPTLRIFLPGAEMDLERSKKFVHKINKIKPALLQGYVDVVYEFALFLLDHNLKIHPPKMVWVTSAPLLKNQRKVMEKAFGAPVCDQYGNTEVLLIAAECPKQKGLHVFQDAVHVEFVDDNNLPVKPNTTGKILITDLNNYAFPLIRYEIGDRGHYSNEKCDCDIPLPLMGAIKGRQAVTLKMPSGLVIKGEHLHILFDKKLKYIREIQLLQKIDYSIEIHFVNDPKINVDAEINDILNALLKKTRQEVAIVPVAVDSIEIKNNKKPLIISQLDS